MKAIAMKCTQEQFESVKSKVNHATITKFEDCPFLTNNWVDSKKVSNITEEFVRKYKSEFQIHETWNEKIFLEACGIEVEETMTLEKVKEYFKDADEVEDVEGTTGTFSKSDERGIHQWGKDFWICAENMNVMLYSKDEGFARILTTKEKTFSITAEQLMQLENGFTLPKLKQWFPEVFNVKLEVGKWYKRPHNKALFFIVSDPEVTPFEVYGFDMSGDWMNAEKARTFPDFEIEATKQEVFEALKNEAVRRGFVEGTYFKNASGEEGKICELKGNKFKYGFLERVNLHEKDSEGIVFESGKWATIIPTITKLEAEKLLNRKIID